MESHLKKALWAIDVVKESWKTPLSRKGAAPLSREVGSPHNDSQKNAKEKIHGKSKPKRSLR